MHVDRLIRLNNVPETAHQAFPQWAVIIHYMLIE